MRSSPPLLALGTSSPAKPSDHSPFTHLACPLGRGPSALTLMWGWGVLKGAHGEGLTCAWKVVWARPFPDDSVKRGLWLHPHTQVFLSDDSPAGAPVIFQDPVRLGFLWEDWSRLRCFHLIKRFSELFLILWASQPILSLSFHQDPKRKKKKKIYRVKVGYT